MRFLLCERAEIGTERKKRFFLSLVPVSARSKSEPQRKRLLRRLQKTLAQFCTQSPQAVWPAVGRQERLWGTGILLPQDYCGKTMEAVTELIQSSQSKNLNFFEFSRVSPGAYPLTKKPEDSGYEIDSGSKKYSNKELQSNHY